MAVEPVTSQKTTVTVLRTSWRPGGTRGAAHAGQNAKSSGTLAHSWRRSAPVEPSPALTRKYVRVRGAGSPRVRIVTYG